MDATIEIRRSPEDVYAFVADPANDVKWRKGVVESGLTSDPPLALGSEGYARAGRSVTRWRVVAITPGSAVDWELIEGPFRGSGGYRLEHLDGHTKFTLVADVGPVFGQLGTRQNQADVVRLKELLEARRD